MQTSTEDKSKDVPVLEIKFTLDLAPGEVDWDRTVDVEGVQVPAALVDAPWRILKASFRGTSHD